MRTCRDRHPGGEIANELPQLHDQLLSFFNPVGNRRDQEALERFLEPEDRRREFYERLTKFINLLRVAQSRAEFAEPEWDARLQAYKADLKFFHSLRMSVKLRYAESIDYSEYEDKIRKLLDDHIQAKEVAVIVPEVNIFDERQFESAVAEFTGGSTEALADSIAYRLKKTATEKLEEDPAFYRKFSQMIEDTIEEYRQGRLSEIEYLNRMEGALDQIRTGRDSSLPPQLDGRKDAPAYYGLLVETFTHTAADALSADVLSQVADLAITFEESIRRLQIRDWMYNPIVRNQMCDKLEDALYDARDALGVPLTGGDMDTIVDNVLATAQRRYELSL
ncbi:MAG: DUF3387 domain-containing protein [Chloroflexi bacterium]|uniref:type I restriction enzyme endonuclease domain-containing protein n=1 Tax=Candidatus Flexifilum breve TaxID=3140694 RepID=UPI0031373F28|nr:DUF3387 domain-containing protein [Chloroflexota bacterium]